MARLYSIKKIRDIIGESDNSNTNTNARIREAGELSQAHFIREMKNIRNIPITDATEEEKELINFGGSAYFYYLENGDEKLLNEYKEQVERHTKQRFGRPGLVTRGPF